MSPTVVTPSTGALVSAILTPNAGAGPLQLVGGIGIKLDAEGMVLPVPAYDEAYAQSIETEGGKRTRSTPQNATATGRVLIQGASAGTMEGYAELWQDTIEAVRRNGGTFTHQPNGGGAVTFDVISAYITSIGEDTADLLNYTRRSEFTLVCLPYGRREARPAVTASLAGPIDGFELLGIGGSAPAWAELTLTDTSARNRRFLEIGIEEDYDSGDPAPLYLQATDLTPQAGALSAAAANSVSSQNLNAFLGSAAWSIGSTGTLNHSGRWRIRLRCQGAGYMRLSYKPSGGQFVQTQKDWVLTIGTGWGSLDLGVIDVDGSWEGQIEGYAPDGGAIIIDLLEFIPVARYAKVRAPFVSTTPTGWEAYDLFDHDAGDPATGTTLSDGVNTWAGAGDPDDFTILGSFNVLQRTSTSDASSFGRVLLAGLSLAGFDARLSIWASIPGSFGVFQGLVARYVDANNYLSVGCVGLTIRIEAVVAGVSTLLASFPISPLAVPTPLRVVVNANGAGVVTCGGAGQFFSDDSLGVGGALANGDIGPSDANVDSGAVTRFYDSFYVAAFSTTEPVIESGRSFLIDQEHSEADHSDGIVTPDSFEGSYLRLDPAKVHRLVVRARRNDDEVEVDAGVGDTLDASLIATPRVVLLTG